MLLGLDIGSSAIAAVLLSEDGGIQNTWYASHEGRIGKKLAELNVQLAEDSWKYPVSFSSSAGIKIGNKRSIDPQTALVHACRGFASDSAYILHVGAEKFYLIRLDPEGLYESSKTSTSCAAGTGSFLEQQSRRLQIESIEEFCKLAAANRDPLPDIASRCSVFAKTDLIHAQQEGYSSSAICEGLCMGLARNLSDTLFQDFHSTEVIIFTGGVSLNQVVKEHLSRILGTELLVPDQSHLYGALGAGILAMDSPETKLFHLDEILDYYSGSASDKKYYYAALKPDLRNYPDFSSVNFRLILPVYPGFSSGVQEEIFSEVPVDAGYGLPEGMYIGIDVGSTSTKAMITDAENHPLLGYYTYTSGKPVEAVFSIFRELDRFMQKQKQRPRLLGIGTTGSGRQLCGKILNADLVLDEITAHARAASFLDPEIDTIIEIGGQDSKFTVLNRGEVVFSQMNTVCAAGTGSFIEEQAKKLGVPLSEYSARVLNQASPLTSDRCTVFMERDLNYLVNQGYTVDELLAAVLYSVRENYFRKVAMEGMIGEKICFQGATAKNRALVAVFEERLKKDIHVSKYCHLTGALGICLTMKEEGMLESGSRGISIHNEKVPVRTEICEICNNRCKLTIARVQDEEVAFGFLCGRDYETPRYRSASFGGFDLLKERQKIFPAPLKSLRQDPVIGIPAALHMFEEGRFWQYFFSTLGIQSQMSRPDKQRLKLGKHLAGAEFCAPVDSMYGHVSKLAETVDFIFLPVVIESRDRTGHHERNYCYYTQFSPSIASQINDGNYSGKLIVPELDFSRKPAVFLESLRKELLAVCGLELLIKDLVRAWIETERIFSQAVSDWKNRFLEEFSPGKDLSVVLLGRPYVILSRELNKNIPEYFSKREVKSFSLDMIPASGRRQDFSKEILQKIPWHFAADILAAAEYCTHTEGLYPVLVTAFKCAPDSIIIEFFKKILDAAEKPYLILQIDEHDSAVGYETRIEAAIRSFRNHLSLGRKSPEKDLSEIIPKPKRKLNGKTLLLPNWDAYSNRLMAAMLRGQGMDVRLLEPDETSMRKSMAHNRGQCTPINIIAQDFIEYVKKNELDPSATMLWMSSSYLTCNFRMYPEYLKHLLDSNGMEKAGVYLGQISNFDLSIPIAVKTYFVYMLGGLLRKMGCLTRPFEMEVGQTDRVIERSLIRLEKSFSGGGSLESAVQDMAGYFNGIKTTENPGRPEVAIFGDFYVRDHEVVNQDLIRFVENAGGMVVTTPYHDFVKLQSENVIRRARKRGSYQMAALSRILMALCDRLDRKYYRSLESMIGIKESINAASLEEHLSEFYVTPYLSGESYDNLLKIFHITEYHPELSLFIQANPAFCCPALITEAITRKITSLTGVPVVTVTYDGTSESKNEIILPYLSAAAGRKGSRESGR